MSKIKSILGYLIIFAVIGGICYFAYYFATNKESTISLKGLDDIVTTSVKVGDEFPLPLPVKAGHTFMGWYFDKECTDEQIAGNAYDIITVTAGNTTLYAKWEKNIYDITFSPYYGNPYEQKIPYGERIQFNTGSEPSKGHRLAWFNEQGEEIVGGIMADQNASFEQRELPKIYKVQYFNPGTTPNELITTRELQFGKTTDLVYTDNEAVLTGHTLTGWYYLNANEQEIAVSETLYVDEDLIAFAGNDDTIKIYGDFTINNYNFAIYLDEATPIDTKSIPYNTNLAEIIEDLVTEYPQLSQDHKQISGWKYVNGDEITNLTNLRMPAQGIAIQPIYIIDKYLVNFAMVFEDEVIEIKQLQKDYFSQLSVDDIPSNEETYNLFIQTRNENSPPYDYYEFGLESYYIGENPDENTQQAYDVFQVVDAVSNIVDDVNIWLIFKKGLFFIEYYTDKECTQLYQRDLISEESNFYVAKSLTFAPDSGLEFGGWVFAEDDTISIEYDSFDFIKSQHKDVKVYADIYYNEGEKWELFQIQNENVGDESTLKFGAFKYTGTQKNVAVPRYIVELGDGNQNIFSTASNVERVLISEGTKVINSYAFANVNAYVKFKNNESNQYELTIKKDAFTSDASSYEDDNAQIERAIKGQSIKSIKLPSRTTLIEEGAFEGCCDLQRIEVSSNCVNYMSIDGVLYERLSNGNLKLIAYPYANARTEFEILEDVEIIGEGAFMYKTKLYSKMSGTVRLDTIEPQNRLQRLTIADNNCLRAINDYAFYGNYQLREINFNLLPNLETIGKEVFFSCFNTGKSINTNEFESTFTFDVNNLSEIPSGFLAYARALNTLTLNNTNNIVKYAEKAFYRVGYCAPYNNMQFVLNRAYESIGSYAFAYIKAKIEFGPSFSMNGKTIGSYAFSGVAESNKPIGIFFSTNNYVFSNIKISNSAFSSTRFHSSVEFRYCDFLGNSVFSGGYIKGDLTIRYSTNKQCAIRNVGVEQTLSIIYESGDGEIKKDDLLYINCSKLVLSGVATIDNEAFGNANDSYSSNAIKEIVFNENCSITQLGAGFFYACEKLERITLCSSINSINANLFSFNYRVMVLIAPGQYGYVVQTKKITTLASVIVRNNTVLSVTGGTLDVEGIPVNFYVSNPSSYYGGIWQSLYNAGRIKDITTLSLI